MTSFILSQLLIAIAIGFDFLSFQFKDRRKIVFCLFCAGALIASHFILLKQWTAAGLTAIASIRYLLSVFSTARVLKYLFCGVAVLITGVTYAGLVSVISCTGSILQTLAAFHHDDRRLREIMLVGTSFWLLHNYLIGSPAAVLMEVLFIASNALGYYRYYLKDKSKH